LLRSTRTIYIGSLSVSRDWQRTARSSQYWLC